MLKIAEKSVIPSRFNLQTAAGLLIAIATLYFAREVLIPIALALLLSFLLAPAMVRLQRWGFRKAVAALVVVTLSLLWACSRREDEIRSEIRPIDSTPAAEHIAGTKGDVEAIESFDPKKAAALFGRFRKNGTAQCPTLVQLRKFASTADPAFVADPRLKYVPHSVKQMWQERLEGPLKEVRPYSVKVYPKQLQLVNDMQKAGVMIIAGTDAGWGNPYTFPGFSLHDELELLVRAGLSPLEALRTATLNPAIFMNMRDKFGTVEKGRTADLVLLDANPLEDIANTRRISAVVLNGSILIDQQLQQMLVLVEQKARTN
jgi:Amidohydrolase family